MSLKSIKLSASYVDRGKIQLSNKKILEWKDLRPEAPPVVPYGTEMEMTITFEQNDYLNGKNGIVWATYDQHQAEVICGTLRALEIECEVLKKKLKGTHLHLIRILQSHKIPTAVDFIWRDETGLKLQPDWVYPANTENESFQRWVNEK